MVAAPKATEDPARSENMAVAEPKRVQLEAILEDLRHAKTPIDNPRIERALIALIETVLETGAPDVDAQSHGRMTGLHGA
jgi:hypothetical protein